MDQSSPETLLDFEPARTRISPRLARVSIWLVLAFSLAPFLIVVAAPGSWWPGSQPDQAPEHLGLWRTFAVTGVSTRIADIRSHSPWTYSRPRSSPPPIGTGS